MEGSIIGVSSGDTGIGVMTATSDNAVYTDGVVVWGLVMDSAVLGSDFWLFDYGPPTLTPSELEFQEQKRMFNEIPPLLLEQYRGMFVASRNGIIVDTDTDFADLTNRFFRNFGDVPVYMAKVGYDEDVFIETPFDD